MEANLGTLHVEHLYFVSGAAQIVHEEMDVEAMMSSERKNLVVYRQNIHLRYEGGNLQKFDHLHMSLIAIGYRRV